MRWLALIMLVGGCDALFRIDPVEQPPREDAEIVADGAGSAVVDAMVDAIVPADSGSDDIRIPGCPPSYYTISTELTKYRVVNSTVTFQTAASMCAADRGNYANHTHLVVFDDDQERSAVNATVSGAQMWIGLADIRVEQAYEWVSSENPNYPPAYAWQNGAPDTTPGADCGLMLGNSDLQMFGCSNLFRYICECDLFPNDPNHYTP